LPWSREGARWGGSLATAEMEEAIDEVLRAQDRIKGWKREGLSGRQIIQRQANELGVTVEEVERERRAILGAEGALADARPP
jgi:hypothetical protein